MEFMHFLVKTCCVIGIVKGVVEPEVGHFVEQGVWESFWEALKIIEVKVNFSIKKKRQAQLSAQFSCKFQGDFDRLDAFNWCVMESKFKIIEDFPKVII